MDTKIYSGTRLKEVISITELVSVHYFELAKDYKFPGEQHDFWEFVYVDKGELTAYSGSRAHTLKSGDIIFHKPDEWHTLIGNGVAASSVAVISFKSYSEAMSGFCGKVLKTGSVQRTLLSKIISEASAAFDTPLAGLVTPKLHRRKNALFGSEQMVKLCLCELLITFLRNEASPAVTSLKRNLDSGLFGEIVDFMSSQLGSPLTLSDIARHSGISKTAVKQLFKEQAGCGACEYFIRMKIDRAKTYIRENNYNFTQIAELLGYDSIHYFSRQFKQHVNMSPTEYAGSIRALTNEAAGLFSDDDKKNSGLQHEQPQT